MRRSRREVGARMGNATGVAWLSAAGGTTRLAAGIAARCGTAARRAAGERRRGERDFLSQRAFTEGRLEWAEWRPVPEVRSNTHAASSLRRSSRRRGSGERVDGGRGIAERE